MSTLSAASDLRIARAEHGGGVTREQLERELANLHGLSFGWALSCCRWDHEEARDVLQIAYLRALETAHAFNGDATARCWFFGVVRNTAAERRRARLIRGAAFKRWLLR